MRTLIRSAGIITLMLASQAVFAAERVDYLREVKPILTARCYACHGALKQQGKLRLDTAELIRKGGSHGPAIIADDAAGSSRAPLLPPTRSRKPTRKTTGRFARRCAPRCRWSRTAPGFAIQSMPSSRPNRNPAV
jgi:hypothetical protein